MYWADCRSTRAREKRAPDCTVRSMMWPPRMSRSFMRTCAEPRPILMCWTSSTWYSVPSISRVTPFLRSPVSIMRTPHLFLVVLGNQPGKGNCAGCGRRAADGALTPPPSARDSSPAPSRSRTPPCPRSARRPSCLVILSADHDVVSPDWAPRRNLGRCGVVGQVAAPQRSLRHLRRVAHHPRLPVLELHHILDAHAAPAADVDPRLDRGDHAVLQLVLR